MMIPKNIKRNHIINAIAELDKDINLLDRRHSTRYDLYFNENFYPPKLVVSIANKYANGNELPADSFITDECLRLLEKLNFMIQEKEVPTYIKRITKQDETRTTVISNESVTKFFNINLSKRDDSAFVSLFYINTKEVKNTEIKKKQDHRIFLEKQILGSYFEGNIIVFKKERSRISVECISRTHDKFDFYNKLIDEKGNNVLLNLKSNPKYFFLKAKSERWDCDAIDIVPIGYKQAYSRQNDKTGNFHPFFGNEEKDMKLGDKIILYQTEDFRSVYGFMEVIDINKKEINLELKEKSKKRITLNELREIPILKDITIIMNKQMGNIAALSKDQYLSIYNINFNKMNLNTILYGPPGTGKTYSTITKALDIIGVKYTSYKDAQELFQNELGKRIEFVTMHQSFSYEDFVQGLKPKKGEKGIEFDYKNGIFKEICRRAYLSKKQYKVAPTEDRVDFEVVYDFSFSTLFEDNEPITISRGSSQFNICDFSDKTLWFETSSGTTHPRYTLAKKTLKKIYNAKENKIIKSGNKGYFDATLKLLLSNEELLKNDETSIDTDGNINHVIILDEINRANISRVFGELIALIEEDKRDGKLSATLPSGDSFTVPSNLHIIGTMNTADKSIALVDIALRRRFKFIAMYPNIKTLETVLKEKGKSEDEITLRVHILKNLNRIIRLKKSVDFEIGHSYFMSNDDLVDIMNDQVIPLLNEYFMYDLRVVKELLEKQQKDKEGNKIPRIGIEFDVNEFKERGLLKVNSVDNAKIVEVNDQIDEDISSEEEN